MGEIIIKVPGDVKEVFEVDMSYEEVLKKLGVKKEKKHYYIKELINKTFGTLREDKQLETKLEEEWYSQ